MYVLVLFVALVGAAIARFEPREASIALFVTAGAQALVVAVIALVAGAWADPPGGRLLYCPPGSHRACCSGRRVSPPLGRPDPRNPSGALVGVRVGAPSGHAAMQTLLPARSARIHAPGARCRPRSGRPRRGPPQPHLGVLTRDGHVDVHGMAERLRLGSSSCIQTVEPWPSGSTALSSDIGA